MNALDSSTSPTDDAAADASGTAGVYATHEDAFQHSLVVLAMGRECWLVPQEDGHHLRVRVCDLPAARRQLASYDRESIGWPPRIFIEPGPALKRLPLTPLLWIIAIFMLYWLQGERPGLTEGGLLDASRVFGHGEWWRIGSALGLHQDLGHVVSNAGGGLLVFSALISSFGLRRAWTWLALAALSGNALAVLMHHGTDYRSLGASTAVFAGLGLLTGRATQAMRRSGHPQRWRALLVPLLSGVAVLGLMGAGGANIDLLAHATGFASGLLLGFLAPGFIHPTISKTG
jgi:membrane associated rhomboid family serine protease